MGGVCVHVLEEKLLGGVLVAGLGEMCVYGRVRMWGHGWAHRYVCGRVRRGVPQGAVRVREGRACSVVETASSIEGTHWVSNIVVQI